MMSQHQQQLSKKRGLPLPQKLSLDADTRISMKKKGHPPKKQKPELQGQGLEKENANDLRLKMLANTASRMKQSQVCFLLSLFVVVMPVYHYNTN